MAIDSDIRDQAYQFFIQEAPELLHTMETELLTLRADRSDDKVHNLMRAAHSLKGSSAYVGLEAIKTLSHRLEDIFKTFHHEELEIDEELESLLLQAYDCLRDPLVEQLNCGYFNAEQALATAEPVLAQLEEQLKDFLGREDILPTAGEDMMLKSIFEVDVAQGLDRLASVLANPEGKQVAGEVRAEADVFSGIAELCNLPGFGAIATTTLAALDAHPEQALHIAQLAVADFQAAHQAVMAGDRTRGGEPSPALAKLADPSMALSLDGGTSEQKLQLLTQEETLPPSASLDDIFGSADLTSFEPLAAEATPDTNLGTQEQEILSIPSLDDIFGGFEPTFTDKVDELAQASSPEIKLGTQESEMESAPSLDDIFGGFESTFTENVDELPQSVAASSPEIKLGTQESEMASAPSLDDIFGGFASPTETTEIVEPKAKENIQEIVQSIEQAFDRLPPVQDLPAKRETTGDTLQASPQSSALSPPVVSKSTKKLAAKEKETAAPSNASAQLSVRVDVERLERMNNLVGELAINRNSLSLQNEQLQGIVQELLRRFAKFQAMTTQVRDLSDQMLVAPESYGSWNLQRSTGYAGELETNNSGSVVTPSRTSYRHTEFDSLEMDSYGELHLLLQDTLEEMVQLEEIVGDVALVAGQSNKTLEGQRQMLTGLRDDLMWARMLPIGEVLSRFPRTLRDLSTTYHKPVDLKLSGTGVLVDKAALEKLYDPLLHLLRNAFDHGIELPEVRREQNKPERGQIEIKAYHQGSQTIIEIRDDGKGVNLDRVRAKAVDVGLLSPEQVAAVPTGKLLDLLFEPGFSTASKVSELSGRGVGLDVVRSQLRSLKGKVTVTSSPGKGTSFILRIPLTLTIAKLLVCLVGTTAYALPTDSIEEILIPKAEKIKHSGQQRFLHWRRRIVPVYHLSQILEYACPLPESLPSQALVAVPTPESWAPPMLMIRQDNQFLALEIDRLVTEQELVIKPFGAAIAPPNYIYGCTILGDGSVVPVLDSSTLVTKIIGQDNTGLGGRSAAAQLAPATANALPASAQKKALSAGAGGSNYTGTAPLILVVDDSIALRQTLALTLQKAGYRVLQARDGREGIEQLQKNSNIQLVVSDVEMPNMNGFEFLTHRRQDPQLSKIPVVMLTSRSSDKHRKLATHLGASAYFTKPYLEHDFLAGIKSIIDKTSTT